MSVPTPSAIEAVSNALVTLLGDGLRGISVNEDSLRIELLSPGQLDATDVHLSVFLYRITRNGDVSNVNPRMGPDGTVHQPPLALDLYYLLTAPSTSTDSASPETADTYEQHRVLGRAVQVLQDNPVLRGVQSGEDVRITINTQSMDEVLNVWNTFQETPYQPSISYLLSPVLIESSRADSTVPVAEWQASTFTRGESHRESERADDTGGGVP